MPGPNPLHPDLMDAVERREELVAILVVGLMRLRARQSSRLSAELENSFVDFVPNQSGGAVETSWLS
ncbi:hypothetical protein A6B35_27005 [Mesorhizobium amorphae CCNWGS0123]|nr:hypothetical protein A6B35_27005 [Mesorhizobium amorphae CCNWGS0123]